MRPGSFADQIKKIEEILLRLTLAIRLAKKLKAYRSNCTIFKSDFKFKDETGQIL